jgi:hypothetical protein
VCGDRFSLRELAPGVSVQNDKELQSLLRNAA